MNIKLWKAQAIGPDQSVPDLDLVAHEPIPDAADPAVQQQVFAEQGLAIVVALARSLPGGTVDQVLAELLRRKASQFVVPFEPV